MPEGLPAVIIDHARDRRPAHGGAQRGHPPAARGRDARRHLGDLLRQDRHADAQRDDGAARRRRPTTRPWSTAPATRPQGEIDGRRRTTTTRRALARGAAAACAAACCATTRTCTSADGAWVVEGDPMEGALVTLAIKAGLDPEHERAEWPRARRDPVRRRAPLHGDAAPRPRRRERAVRQGRAGARARRCARPIAARSRALARARSPPLPARASACWRSAMQALSDAASRLRFADLADGLVFLGLVGFIDPPRAGGDRGDRASAAPPASRVKMITGDHAATAPPSRGSWPRRTRAR